MPISNSERVRLKKHEHVDEHDIDEDGIYISSHNFVSLSALMDLRVIKIKDLRKMLLGVPQTLVLSAFLFVFFYLFSLKTNIWLWIGGAALFYLLFSVSSTFQSDIKRYFAGLDNGNKMKEAVLSATSMQPLVYILGMVLLYVFAVALYIPGYISYLLLLIIFASFAILHLAMLRYSFAPMILYAKKTTDRSKALNNSWHLLTNSTLGLALINFICFLIPGLLAVDYAFFNGLVPFIIFFIAELIFGFVWSAVGGLIYKKIREGAAFGYQIN